jgi:hypothetical protein
MSTDLADPASGSTLRRTGPSGHQTIEATPHVEDASATPKARLSDRTAESSTQPSTSAVIFRPCFHGALNWQVWQVGFLFVFSVQFDGEKPDKITRGACACNDDKVIFENPLIYSAGVFRVPGMN